MACAGRSMILRGALAIVDLLVGGSVEAAPIAAPPASPILGTFYRIAAAGASGVFAGHEGSLAGWSDAGWRFVAPVEGMRLTERGSGVEFAFRDGAWTSGSIRGSEVVIGGAKLVGDRLPPIAGPVGGSAIDTEVRTAVGQILSALRTHGLIAS